MSALSVTPEGCLSGQKQQSFDVLMNWDMSKVNKRFAMKNDCSDGELELLEREYKKFISLKLFEPELKYPVSEVIDEYWHTHLLFSRDYHEMSKRVFGDYAHHHPIVDENEKEELMPLYNDNTLAQYRKVFGDPDPVMWPQSCLCGSCY